MTHSNATYTKTIKPVRKEASPGAYEAQQRARKVARQQARKDKQEARHG